MATMQERARERAEIVKQQIANLEDRLLETNRDLLGMLQQTLEAEQPEGCTAWVGSAAIAAIAAELQRTEAKRLRLVGMLQIINSLTLGDD